MSSETHSANAAPAHPANRLARESSPYLRQHAHNPVDWWPWGPEAIAEARRRNVPIFLSIGYSTCYWCHVMERESFENEETARIMNERFVNVKVDREERPEIDDIYMVAVQMLTGRGGWPMSVFLEPTQLRPYWGGTYFPPRDMHGIPAFSRALESMSDAWRDRREDVLKQAEAIAAGIRDKIEPAQAAAHIGRPQVSMAVQTLLTIFDRVHGGFSDAPKFPQPVYLELLLDIRERTVEAAAKHAIDEVLRLTLDRMALGGMFDQVGGGFHRYSVDHHWLVPHFEKMLYDQGQLLSVYARASAVFGDAFYERIAARIIAYAERELLTPQGLFFTAQDAEVDGREGLNYLWLAPQIEAILGESEGTFINDLYGVASGPNFTDPHHPAEPARSVLFLHERCEKTAQRHGMTTADLLARVDRCNARLLAARDTRKQPRLDDKIVTAWNGLMLSGLAAVAKSVRDESLRARALGLAQALAAGVRQHLLTADGGGAGAVGVVAGVVEVVGSLLRCGRFEDGRLTGTIPGVLEDYGSILLGLCDLAAVSSGDDRTSLLRLAESLAASAKAHFGQTPAHAAASAAPASGFFDSAAGRDDLFVRSRTTYDGAMPCGASLMNLGLVRLAVLTGAPQHLASAAAAIASVSAAIEDSPIATANSTRALFAMLQASEETLHAALLRAGAIVATSDETGSAARSNRAARAPAHVDTPDPSDPEPVEVYSSIGAVELGPDLPTEFAVRLSIKPGYHVYAANPGNSPAARVVQPLRVGIAGGAGITAYADYPPGTAWGPDSIHVLKGEIEFDVALEQSGDWIGSPRLVVSFQACTDTACDQPRTVELDVAINQKP